MLSVGESIERGDKAPSMALPPYGDLELAALYWDARHARSGAAFFDWYLDYSRLRPIIQQEFPSCETHPEILDVGFGTSEVPTCLFNDGWEFVTAIDISADSVRLALQRRKKEQKAMQFLQMDACHLNFPDQCFHVVFDKATFDTLVCSSRPNFSAQAYLSEVFRVLQPGGIFLMISHSGPAERLPYLVQDPCRTWKVQAVRQKNGGAEAEENEDAKEDYAEETARSTTRKSMSGWVYPGTPKKLWIMQRWAALSRSFQVEPGPYLRPGWRQADPSGKQYRKSYPKEAALEKEMVKRQIVEGFLKHRILLSSE